MEKEEKKAGLEQLLNSLIEKGWKPFGNKKIKDAKTARWNINLLNEEVNKVSKFKDKVAFTNWVLIFDEINLRELVSKESWLWQFVCENGMIKKEWNSEWAIIYPNERTGDYQKCHSYCKWQSEYWILESALKDESELEDFLLNSIKLD